MKLIFMGTPEFAVPTLETLADAGHEILAVYTQPPRPAGRGKKEQKSAVHQAAEARGYDVRTPRSLKSEEEQTALAALDADCAVVVAYGQILPQAVLDAPEYGCINVHASLLPRWRGAAPIHRAIMAGDTETGVCIMQMGAGLDTGPVLARATTPIAPKATTAELHDELAALGAQQINEALKRLADGTIKPEPQPEAGVTYAHKIDKAEARIDWRLGATEIDRQVRGLFPFPGAWTTIQGERVKILSGEAFDSAPGAPAGTTLDGDLLIACGEGRYRITRAQRAGKAAMALRDFMRGFPVPAGGKVG